LAKQVGGDIIEKKTYLYLQLHQLYASRQRVKALLIVLGLQKQRKMRRILRFKAFQMLDQMNISDDKSMLKAFGEFNEEISIILQ
jgi:hypothetical protein